MAILHAVIHLLVTNRYVIVVSLDFTKAFDTVRPLQKMAQLDVPDCQQLVGGGFNVGAHNMEYLGNKSTFVKITATVMQGSGLGPVAFVVNADDLRITADSELRITLISARTNNHKYEPRLNQGDNLR